MEKKDFLSNNLKIKVFSIIFEREEEKRLSNKSSRWIPRIEFANFIVHARRRFYAHLMPSGASLARVLDPFFEYATGNERILRQEELVYDLYPEATSKCALCTGKSLNGF